MQLSPEQIDQLFAFTRKKRVHWFDLQAELVDHLASRIEEGMEQDPTLTFEEALRRVYAGFGLFGFAHIVQQKQVQLQRSSRGVWWRHFRSFFGWPHLLLVAATVVLLWQLAHRLPPLSVFLLVLLPVVLTEGQLLVTQRKRRQLARPLLLLELSPLRFTAGIFFAQLLINFSRHWSPVGLFVFGLSALLCLLVNRAALAGHRAVWAEAQQLYPEAFARS